MKSIIYILIIVFVGSIIISALPQNKKQVFQSYAVECISDNFSSIELEESAAIFDSRLKEYGIQNADISRHNNSSVIEISFHAPSGLPALPNLLTSEGRVEFYETFDRIQLMDQFGRDSVLYSLLIIPAGDDQLDRSSGILGYCTSEKKAAVDAYLESHYLSASGEKINFYWSEQPDTNGNYYLFVLRNNVSLDNSSISDVKVILEESGDQPALLLNFNEKGKPIWKETTRRNIGRSIALVVDKKVIQAPVVKSEIGDGRCLITGKFPLEDLHRISALINNKILPLEFELKN